MRLYAGLHTSGTMINIFNKVSVNIECKVGSLFKYSKVKIRSLYKINFSKAVPHISMVILFKPVHFLSVLNYVKICHTLQND